MHGSALMQKGAAISGSTLVIPGFNSNEKKLPNSFLRSVWMVRNCQKKEQKLARTPAAHQANKAKQRFNKAAAHTDEAASTGIHIDIYKTRKSAADEKIISYNDVVLRRSDLDILSGPYFLNDRIIEFYFSYLPSCYPSEEILLVSPSIAFWIANCPDIERLKDFVEPLNLSSKKLVIFPVNNNDDVTEAEGGNHWSLLLFERKTNVFVHHDSYRGLNAGHAKQLYRAIVGYMGISDMASACKYVEYSKTPQQVNGYDCGLYIAAIAKAICSWYESKSEPKDEDGLWFSTMNEQVNPSVVAEMRNEILGLVKSLMAMK